MVGRLVLIAAVAAASAFVGKAHAANNRPVDCELTVAGKTYIQGRCQFSPESDGSFRISGGDYFAQVSRTARDVGEAYWNADPKSTHAQARLGTVKRKGACWTGQGVKICARALPAGNTAAALAAQPDGMMLWPDFAPSACIGVEGQLAEGATPVLHNCKLPADLIFETKPDGTLSIRKHPELCIGATAPGAGKPAQLVLVSCRPGTRTWRWKGSSTGSAAVESADGTLCWTIPQASQDPNASFPWTVSPQPCGKGTAEAVMLNLSRN